METRTKIANALIAKAKELFSREDIDESTSFIDDLKAKSVNLVQLVTMLEDMCDVEVQYMKFRRCSTIGQAADFIAALLEE